MTTESERPPSKINGKVTPEYNLWYRQQRKKKVTKTCECGCGETLSNENFRFKNNHFLRVSGNREKLISKITAACQTAAVRKIKSDVLLKMGESHHSAKPWRVISPDNVKYEFRNVHHFVRSHAHLFHPDDLAQKFNTKGRDPCCNASRGIQSLSPRRKRPNGTWKGWRIDSQQERLFHEGKTLLEDITPPVSSSTTRENPPQ